MIAFVLLLIGVQSAKAADGDRFDVKVGAWNIHFRITSESDATVAIALDKKGRPNTEMWGSFTLPTSVSYGGKTYSVTSVDPQAFMGNTGLTSVTIPGDIKTIGSQAFQGCKKMVLLTLKEGIERMGDLAFFDCDELTNVTIPKSMSDAGEGPFADCDNLTTINCASGGYYYTIGPVLYKGKKLVQFPSGADYEKDGIIVNPYTFRHVKAFNIPKNITQIGKWAIMNTKIENLGIHEMVELVDFGAVLDNQHLHVYLAWDENTIVGKEVNENNFNNAQCVYVPKGTLGYFQNRYPYKNAKDVSEWDDAYTEVLFGGQPVTRSICENLTLGVTSGKVSYDRFKRMFVIQDAVINTNEDVVFTMNEGCQGIEVHGANSIENTGGSSAILVRGNASPIVSGIDYWRETKQNPKLIIQSEGQAIKLNNNAELQWESVEFQMGTTGDCNVVYGDESSALYMYDSPGGMHNRDYPNRQLINIWGDFYWGGMYVSDPPYAVFVPEANSICYAGTQTPVTKQLTFSLEGDMMEGITIGGQSVTSSHVPFLEKGSLTWDADGQTLTLKNATINVPNGEGLRVSTGLTLNIVGTNTITSKGNAIIIMDGDSQFSGTGSLKVNSTEGYGLVYDYYLDFASGSYDIHGKLGALDGTSRRGFIGDFVVNCPMRLSSDGQHDVVRNAMITDNSSAYQLNYAVSPNDCYFIATPGNAYYDPDKQSLCHVGGNAVKTEIVYKTGRELGYQRFPLSIASYPVSNLNRHQIVKGVSFIPDTTYLDRDGAVLTIAGDISAWGNDAIRVEDGLTSLSICVDGQRTVSAKSSYNDAAALHIAGEDAYVYIYDSRPDKNKAATLSLIGDINYNDGAYGIRMDKHTHLTFYSLSALVSGKQAISGNTESSYLNLEHSNVVFNNADGYAPVTVYSLNNYHSHLTTAGVRFSSTSHCFINENTGTNYLGAVTYEQRHPTVWIAGKQVDCPQPAIGENNTGMAYYDFSGDVLTLQDAHIENNNGPAIRFLCDDTWHMQTDTYMSFSGDCYLKGKYEGILVEGVHDEQHDEYPYYYMSFRGRNEDGSDRLTIVAEDGPGIYWKCYEGGEFSFYDLNLDIDGVGAVHGDSAPSDYFDIKSIAFVNCSVKAKNRRNRYPTFNYFGDLYMKDCYFLAEDTYLDSDKQCVCDGNGNPIYDEIRILRGHRGDEPLGISHSASRSSLSAAPFYNLQGQKVDEHYKGIIICNGKKILKK